jgi:predicted NBD/HSP70 family sugar kinase
MTKTTASSTVPPVLILRTPAAVDVFKRILMHGPIGRIAIGRRTGLSQAAVTKAVTPLIAEGIVHEDVVAQTGLSRGRPVYPLSVIPMSLLALGVKVNRDEVIGVATTMRAEVLHTVHRPLADSGVDSVVDAVAAVSDELRADLGADAPKVIGIGVAVSGEVDTPNGVVRNSPLLGWADVPLQARLAERLDLPILIDNDVHALTIAEQWFGVGVDVDSFAIVTIGSGIGSGIYLNGDVVSGAHGVAGELGHLPLASDDLVCTCGRRGCVEAEASSSAIVDTIRRETGRPELSMHDAVELAHRGDPAAIRAFDRAGTVIGSAIAALANLVGPAVVLVAGESVVDFDLYEHRIRQSFAAHAFGAAAQCQIVTRSHTFDDWARGAAATIIRAAFRQSVPSQG